MKIEKVSDNQIRCQLTKEDLAERQIRISELAYGSDKARKLFREMMTQAYTEYGFSNEGNIPLMIEAIPGRGSALTIIITKVEDPEELDTRFAKFSPTTEVPDGSSEGLSEGADAILDMLRRILESGDDEGNTEGEAKTGETLAGGQDSKEQEAVVEAPKHQARAPHPKMDPRGRTRAGIREEYPELTRAYKFDELDDVIRASEALGGFYMGTNTLYHLPGKNGYLLVMHQSKASPEEFNKVCNVLSEYGTGQNFTHTQEAYLHEHSDAVIEKKALQKLMTLA